MKLQLQYLKFSFYLTGSVAQFANLVLSRHVPSVEKRDEVMLPAGAPANEPPPPTALASGIVAACAFCVAPSAPASAACGGRARRAYCGAECARADWGEFSGGQQHARWCALRCGEEGREWAVVDCGAERGLGVVALVDLPAGARVLVDKALLQSAAVLAEGGARRAAALALTPVNNGGDLDAVFLRNEYGGRDGPVIGVRLSRVNHSCDPNAQKVADDDLGVNVVCALRSIRAGEEVTIAYLPCDDPTVEREPEEARAILLQHWGIACPADCRCRNEALAALVARARALDARILALGGRCDVGGAVAAAEELMSLYDEMGLSPLHMARARTLYDAFQVAVMNRARAPEAAAFLRRALDIHARCYHPDSSPVTDYERLVREPSSHANYGVAD